MGTPYDVIGYVIVMKIAFKLMNAFFVIGLARSRLTDLSRSDSLILSATVVTAVCSSVLASKNEYCIVLYWSGMVNDVK